MAVRPGNFRAAPRELIGRLRQQGGRRIVDRLGAYRMAQAMEALTADLPLVLFLEDLSDCSTLELISSRSTPSRHDC